MRGLLRNIGVVSLQTYINVSYERFGEMTELKIDPQNRRIEATLMLHGEKEAIQVSLDGYQLTQVDDQTLLSFQSVSTSRQWLSVLVNDLLKDRPLPIPNRAAKILRMLLG